MELEIIVQGKGSITVKQEVDWTRKQVEKLASFSMDLINSTAQKGPYGFEGGTSAQVEASFGDPPSELGFVDRTVRGR